MAIFGNKNKDKNNENEKVEKVEKAAEETAAPAAEKAEETAFDFNRYFLAERRIVLENVSYETHAVQPSGTLKLGAKDTIVAQLVGQAGVKVTYNRLMQFDPEGPFTISVSFAVMLVFNPGTRDELDWKTVDVATEFRKACPAIVAAMMSRASLMVAQLTSAAGGIPIIPAK